MYTERQIRYAVKKAADSTFHPLSHGGARNVKFTDEERELMHQALWDIIQKKPHYQLFEMARDLEQSGFEVSSKHIHRVRSTQRLTLTILGVKILEILAQTRQSQALDQIF